MFFFFKKSTRRIKLFCNNVSCVTGSPPGSKTLTLRLRNKLNKCGASKHGSVEEYAAEQPLNYLLSLQAWGFYCQSELRKNPLPFSSFKLTFFPLTDPNYSLRWRLCPVCQILKDSRKMLSREKSMQCVVLPTVAPSMAINLFFLTGVKLFFHFTILQALISLTSGPYIRIYLR